MNTLGCLGLLLMVGGTYAYFRIVKHIFKLP